MKINLGKLIKSQPVKDAAKAGKDAAVAVLLPAVFAALLNAATKRKTP